MSALVFSLSHSGDKLFGITVILGLYLFSSTGMVFYDIGCVIHYITVCIPVCIPVYIRYVIY